MQGLIQDLLSYSRAGANGGTLQEISCERALARAVRNLQATIEESAAIVTHNVLPMIVTDETQLVQVFQNLIGNATKYRGTEPPAVHVSASREVADEWIFSVRDNGLGIEPSISIGYLSSSSACTGETSTRAQESDWPCARRSWTGWAAAFGSSHNSRWAQPSTSPCLQESNSHGFIRRLRPRHRSSPGRR